jgi:hypothetical protein
MSTGLFRASKKITKSVLRSRREQALQAPQQQSRAHEQYQGQRDFHDDQRAARAPLATGGARRAVLEVLVRIVAGSLQRRNHAEGQADQCGHAQTEGEHRGIDTDRAGARQAWRGERRERAHADQRHVPTTPPIAASSRLGEQLPDDATASGAERAAARITAPPYATRKSSSPAVPHAMTNERMTAPEWRRAPA